MHACVTILKAREIYYIRFIPLYNELKMASLIKMYHKNHLPHTHTSIYMLNTPHVQENNFMTHTKIIGMVPWAIINSSVILQ